ncbi:MAG: hypothetical protein MUF58_23090 [Arcicella sp.]|nr:hypothetical protein [Arcicella sp.]
MKQSRNISFFILCTSISLVSFISFGQKNIVKPLIVKENEKNILLKAKEIRDKTPVKLAEGLQMSLWASDSLAPDPVAMSIDDWGRVFLIRTNRQKNSEFDIRGHRDWMTESISFKTVEDRRAFLRKTFAPNLSDKNGWLKDLNEDA